MIWGITNDQREMERIESGRRWRRKFALRPTMASDGRWMWLEFYALKARDNDGLPPWLRVPWVEHCRQVMRESREGVPTTSYGDIAGVKSYSVYAGLPPIDPALRKASEEVTRKIIQNIRR